VTPKTWNGGGAATTTENFFGKPTLTTGLINIGAWLRSSGAVPLKPIFICPASSCGIHPSSSPTVMDPKPVPFGRFGLQAAQH